MKILVTGDRGLVGSAIKEKLSVEILKRETNLLDEGLLLEEFKNIKPDVIIHCAAQVGGILGNLTRQGEFFYNNIRINTNVLETARLAGVPKVISLGSTCAYPENAEMPFKEHQLHLGEPYQTHFAYAYAKRMLEVQSRAYNEQYGLNYFCVISANIYGPNDKFDLIGGHVMPSLLLKGFLAKKQNKPFVVWGSGKANREFIFVHDVADILKKLAEIDVPKNISAINLSTSEQTSIKDVVSMITKALNFSGEVIFDSNYPDGQIYKSTDISLLKELIGPVQFTKIETGIQKTVQWLEQNYPNIRI